MTFLANISISYDSRTKLKEEGELRTAYLERFRSGEDHLGYGADLLVDAEEAEWLTSHGITFEVRRLKGMTGGAGQFTEQVRNITQISIPNVGLLGIDEVFLLEDACTDMVQSYLDDGWRLLAICPPNSQRRPDYIFGRTKGAAS